MPDLCRGDAWMPSNAELEHMHGLHVSHRAELLDRVAADPGIELADLGIGEPGIRLRDRHQRAVAPHGERVIGVQRCAPSVSRLRVHHHGVDAERLHLPLPPSALPPPDAVRRVAPLEHQPLGQLLARARVRLARVIPARRDDDRRQEQRATRPARSPTSARELFAPRRERLAAHIAPLDLEQIVGDEHHGHVRENLRAELLAADAALQLREGKGRAIRPRHDLAVDHGAIGQEFRRRGDLRKAIRHQLVAARPEIRLSRRDE